MDLEKETEHKPAGSILLYDVCNGRVAQAGNSGGNCQIATFLVMEEMGQAGAADNRQCSCVYAYWLSGRMYLEMERCDFCRIFLRFDRAEPADPPQRNV